MKTEVTLLNGVRFAPDTHTRLHVHTALVSPDNAQLVVPMVGPRKRRGRGFQPAVRGR